MVYMDEWEYLYALEQEKKKMDQTHSDSALEEEEIDG